MSLPKLPENNSELTRENSINLILTSIAMEEVGLSHIINAEGEKLQYALGTLDGVTGPKEPATIEELLELNESIHKTLDSSMLNQFLLKEKMQCALSASVMQGPTGPTGPHGPATIAINEEVEKLEPDDKPYVKNVGASDQEVELKFGIPRGATGAKPTVEVRTTETINPGLNASVTAEDTDTGIALNFQIPRGVTGTADAFGIQATLNGGTEISGHNNIVFNQFFDESNSDISYNFETGVFNINQTELNNIYMINWWLFKEGSTSEENVVLALNVGGVEYRVETPFPDMQVSGSALAAVGNESVTVFLTNTSSSTLGLVNVEVQAQITIIGFRRAN